MSHLIAIAFRGNFIVVTLIHLNARGMGGGGRGAFINIIVMPHRKKQPSLIYIHIQPFFQAHSVYDDILDLQNKIPLSQVSSAQFNSFKLWQPSWILHSKIRGLLRSFVTDSMLFNIPCTARLSVEF